jgi:hypothetical protein
LAQLVLTPSSGSNDPWRFRVRLSGTLPATFPEGPDRMIGGMASETVSPLAPQDNPIETQQALCMTVTQLLRDGPPEFRQLDELIALERQALPLSEQLLTRYIEGYGPLHSFDWNTWHSALKLGQSFFDAYDHFLQHIRATADGNWIERERLVLVQLLHHRKVEFLLRFFRYKRRSTGHWRHVHASYRLARERGLLNDSAGVERMDGDRRAGRKLEHQYLQILLLEVMNSGHFSPREALWAYRWFECWCSEPSLQLAAVNGTLHFEPRGFVVDLGGSEGLTRDTNARGDLLYLDPSPLSVTIKQEIASLSDGATVPLRATPAVRAGRLALLHKLANLFAPNPAEIERRSERKAVALTVEAVAGFPYIVEELRRNGHRHNDGNSSTAAPGDDITVSPLGGPTSSPPFTAGGGSPASFSMTGPFDSIPRMWQVKDRSDSGCRMRGQIDNLNRVIPGSLIAIREGDKAPWTVAVVRWFRRLMVDHVEIGVEYLGRKPRFVKLVAGDDRELAMDVLPGSASRCFAALYLPPSERHPNMPIKTLLLPAGEFSAGCDVTLLSSSATYRLRLNEPIQQQFEFVWTSFGIIQKVTAPA